MNYMRIAIGIDEKFIHGQAKKKRPSQMWDSLFYYDLKKLCSKKELDVFINGVDSGNSKVLDKHFGHIGR